MMSSMMLLSVIVCWGLLVMPSARAWMLSASMVMGLPALLAAWITKL